MVFAGGLWLGKKAVAPVAALSAAAESISVENLAERLPMPEAVERDRATDRGFE